MDFEIKTVDEIPPIERSGHSSKYQELISAAVEDPDVTKAVEFKDAKAAHSRAGSVRAVVSKRPEGDDVTVVVRGSTLYVTYSPDGGETPRKRTTKKTTKKRRPAKKS